MSLLLRVSIVLSLVLAAGFDAVRAADDVALLDLVDESAAVCLEVPQLEANWSRFLSSRVADRLKSFPPVERFLAGAGFQKWTRVDEHVRGTTGKSLSDHLLGVCSQSLVVAVYLPEGKAPQGVLIAQARDARVLNEALQAWGTLEPQHDSTTRQHLGQAYVRRAKSPSSTEVVFYVTIGRTIAISDQEQLIQRVIELEQANRETGQPAAPGTMRRSAAWRTNRARLPDDAAAWLLLNTRAWDRVIEGAIGQSSDARWMMPVVRNVAAIAAALRLDDEIVVDLVVDLGNEPASPWRQFLAPTKVVEGWENRIPRDCILAVSSRMNIGPLVQAVLAVSPDVRKDDFARGRNLLKSLLLGRDLFTDVGPEVFRDWTVAVIGASGSRRDDPPLDLVGRFALEIQPGQAPPTIQSSLENAFQFGLTSLGALLSHQRGTTTAPPVVVDSEVTERGTIRSLRGIRTWTPGFAVTPSHLVVGTSRRIVEACLVDSANSNSRLAACEARYFPGCQHLAWLDAAALRSLLAERSDWIAARLAPASTDARQRVEKHLSNLAEAAATFDAAFLAVTVAEDHLRITAGTALDRAE